MKPTNPYKKGSTIWKVMEGDWEDLPQSRIAEALGVKCSTVRTCITRIKRQTGYDVPHISEKERRDKEDDEYF